MSYPFTPSAWRELTTDACTKSTAELAADYRIAKINLARDPSERNRAIMALVQEAMVERFGTLFDEEWAK